MVALGHRPVTPSGRVPKQGWFCGFQSGTVACDGMWAFIFESLLRKLMNKRHIHRIKIQLIKLKTQTCSSKLKEFGPRLADHYGLSERQL